MINFWNKVKNFFQLEEKDEVKDEEIDISYPVPVPMDEKFVKLFTHSGGNFLYCDTLSVAAKYLREIIKSEHISRMICFDSKLQSILKALSINFIEYPSASADCSFIQCESLIAYNGSVVVSSHQIGGRCVQDLPNTFIVIALTSQIESTLKDAMTTIKRNKSNQLPNNITSIGGVGTNQLEGNIIKPTIYLLLVEDNE